MAVNIEMLKEPKYLIVIGVAVVGGIFVASKISSKKTATNDAPIEAPVAVQSVSDTSSLNQLDTLQRQLTDAQQKEQDLVSAQDEKEKSYLQNLADIRSSMESTRASEREQYEARLGQIGSQFGAQIASQTSLIEQLKQQIANLTSSGKTNTENTGPFEPTVPVGNSIPQPLPQQPKPVTTYPGVGDGRLPENTVTSKHGTYEQAYANEKRSTGQNDTFTTRNMVAIALYGTGTPWVPTGTWNVPEAINQRRIRFGLLPLTSSEIQQMLADVARYNSSGGKEPLLAHAKDLFNKWNVPYQAGASVKRF